LPTIRLFNEAPHRFLPQNHERIIPAARRFYTARVMCGRRPRCKKNLTFG
jgi:hypothetical protein